MYLFERVPGIAPCVSLITLCINQLGAKKYRALSRDRARKSQNTDSSEAAGSPELKCPPSASRPQCHVSVTLVSC